jgi:uncharacterized protein (UPF0548 family)
MNILPRFFGRSLSIEEAKLLETNFSSAASLSEKTTSIRLDSYGPLGIHSTQFLFDYDTFPQYIMRAETEWRAEGRSMRCGDVIVQQVFVPPVGLGICLEFAVRISAIFNEEKKLGFAYETLCGHVEKGVSKFYLEERKSGLFFTIQTRSEPGHWAARLFGPLTVQYQKWCTRRALLHVKRRFSEENAISKQ